MPYTYIFMLKHLVCLTHNTQVVNIQSTFFKVDGGGVGLYSAMEWKATITDFGWQIQPQEQLMLPNG